ncbi:MAG: hypothetical protein ABEN55_08210, partial [Bradymonadaceae bacterium]
MPNSDDYVRKKTREVASGSFTLTIQSDEKKKKFWAQYGPKLPDPQHPDQHEIADLAEKRLRAKWSDEKVHRIVTTSPAWDVKSHQWTGAPVLRKLRAIALVENKQDGHCRAVYLTLRQ